MKIIAQRARYTKENEAHVNAGFHEIGTTNQVVFHQYHSVETAVRYGIKLWAKGTVVRCLVFFDDNVHHDPDQTFYFFFDRVYQQAETERRILRFLPRENAMGRTARQIASELALASEIVDDVLESMMQRKLLTHDATGYCWKGAKHHV